MRRVGRRADVLFALAMGTAGAVAASCSLDAGLDGLTGGRPPGVPDSGSDVAPGPDASDDGNGSGSDSTTLDSGAPDSTMPLDAPADVAVDGPFCATHTTYTFCADFDEPGYQDAWTLGTLINPPGNMFQDPNAFTSPRFSLAAEKFAGDSGATTVLVTTLSPLTPALEVAFDLWVVQAGTSGALVAEVQLPDQTFVVLLKGAGPVTLTIDESSRNAEGGISYGNVPGVSFSLATGAWYHVTVDFEFIGSSGGNPAGGNVAVTVGDAGTLSGTPTLPVDLSGTSLQLHAGIADWTNPPFGAWLVRLDNFVALQGAMGLP
jgi:hypothetical protein